MIPFSPSLARRFGRLAAHIESLATGVRNPYQALRLEKFGNISKLTAGVGGPNDDHGQ
jgi:hypothetical protein